MRLSGTVSAHFPFKPRRRIPLANDMQESTCKINVLKQLKNMKNDDRLMRLETRIGGTRSFLDASPEWWEEKIKSHDALLFRNSVVVGYQTITLLQFQNNSKIRMMINMKKIWRAK
ncbi:hypothetical protein LXL04_003343 [Taraxacum kok-saghyz]